MIYDDLQEFINTYLAHSDTQLKSTLAVMDKARVDLEKRNRIEKSLLEARYYDLFAMSKLLETKLSETLAAISTVDKQ